MLKGGVRMSLVWSEYNKNVLIIGYGVVGKNLAKELEPIDYEIRDINIPEYNNSTNKTYRVAFVCVPTEMLPDGSVDTSCVEDAVANVKAQVIVIKSAIPPGTAKTLSNRYSKHIVVSPEYYGATIHAIATPDFLILGGAKGDCQKVAELYYEFKPSDYTIRFTTWETAELSKYMENCYLALKVTFCNEFADIAHSYGVSYPELREVFVSDPRVGRSHTWVYPEQPYYNSHCLNKDIPGLISFANGLAPIMEAMNKINVFKKSNPPVQV